MPGHEGTTQEIEALNRLIEGLRGQGAPALEVGRRVSELGTFLMIGTLQSQERHEPTVRPWYTEGGWKPVDQRRLLATYLPHLALMGAGLGDVNVISQRRRLGLPDAEVVYGWREDPRSRGGFKGYMERRSFESLRSAGPEQVGDIDFVFNNGFQEVPGEGLYFSEDASDRAASYPVTGDDFALLADEYGLELRARER